MASAGARSSSTSEPLCCRWIVAFLGQLGKALEQGGCDDALRCAAPVLRSDSRAASWLPRPTAAQDQRAAGRVRGLLTCWPTCGTAPSFLQAHIAWLRAASPRRISELRVIHLLEDLCDGMDSYLIASDAAGEHWARPGAHR